ncbi:methyltransferase domain-containing protein [Candidatus Poriferisodalis sp.]|uniref:sterol methyltransferase family protein n=1 Tax=Candidatus Poriferisodalis sp. TaxID=3101277 RepID=UPI003B011107
MSSIWQVARGLKMSYRGSDLRHRVEQLNRRLDETYAPSDGPTSDHAETATEYYDICSYLMIYGWGESLHFAPLTPQESLEDSKLRHQRLMIDKLDLHEGMSVIDVGCGIGGPMRTVVREAGVRVTGINSSEVQLARARELTAEAGLSDMIDYVETSFMDMGTIEDCTYDRAYAIESTCHAPDKVGAFTEISRVLKPGALLWGQEMCLTDAFGPDNANHQEIKRELMRGIALKKIATFAEVNRALESAGFEVIEGTDFATPPPSENGPTTPWYQPMETRSGTRRVTLRGTPLGRQLAIGAARFAETLRILPRGTAEIAKLLDRTADAYVAGGKTGIFTPLYCFVARKIP